MNYELQELTLNVSAKFISNIEIYPQQDVNIKRRGLQN